MFILSKVLSLLILPITWIIVLFVMALFTRNMKRKQKLLVITAIVFYIFSAPLFLNLFQYGWDYRDTPLNANSRYSCVIILGGYASERADGDGYFNNTANRFITGVELFETGKASHILLTGGNASIYPDSFRESSWTDGQLKNLHVPDSAIIVENQSRNTIENAVLSKKLLQAKHLQPPYLLVTSGFHMRRALLIFKKAHINVLPYAPDSKGNGFKLEFQSFIPSAYPLAEWEHYTKELVGYIQAALHKF